MGCVEGLTKAFKRLDGVKSVRFLAEETAFQVQAEAAIPEYRNQLTGIIKNWKHYDYSVGHIEISEDT